MALCLRPEPSTSSGRLDPVAAVPILIGIPLFAAALLLPSLVIRDTAFDTGLSHIHLVSRSLGPWWATWGTIYHAGLPLIAAAASLTLTATARQHHEANGIIAVTGAAAGVLFLTAWSRLVEHNITADEGLFFGVVGGLLLLTGSVVGAGQSLRRLSTR